MTTATPDDGRLVPARSTRLDIIFRSCSRVDAFSGPPRFLGVPKDEVVLRSLTSVIQAIHHCTDHRPATEVVLTILDDHSSGAVVRGMTRLLGDAGITTAFRTLEGTGYGESLREAYRFAREDCTELVYLCEDDYLHHPAALTEMLQTYDLLSPRMPRGLILHPYDCPDRYGRPRPHGQYPAQIYLGSTRHWRSVEHTTATFLTSRALVDRYWDVYMAFTRYGRLGVSEDTTINRIYRDVVCVSPMPSLAIHLQYTWTLPPFVDWRAWWERAKPASESTAAR